MKNSFGLNGLTVWSALLMGLVAATGCGGDDDGGSTVDGGVTVDGTVMTVDGAAGPDSSTTGACNMLTNTDPLVTWTVLAQTAPTPAGTTIANGTYKLTAQNFYGSPGVQTLPPQAWTVVVQGNTWQQI